jgi:hypothetical protein
MQLLMVDEKGRKFETLDEHVSDPNKEDYPEREVKVCVNRDCRVHQGGYFFADHGSLYGGALFPHDIPYHAVGSWEWVRDKQSEFEKTRLSKILNYKASRLLCVVGLHFPHERFDHKTMFCGGCHAELENPLFRKHPFFQPFYENWQDRMMKTPRWRRYINF